MLDFIKDHWKSIAGVGMVIAGFATLPLTMNIWVSFGLIGCGEAFIIWDIRWVCF